MTVAPGWLHYPVHCILCWDIRQSNIKYIWQESIGTCTITGVSWGFLIGKSKKKLVWMTKKTKKWGQYISQGLGRNGTYSILQKWVVIDSHSRLGRWYYDRQRGGLLESHNLEKVVGREVRSGSQKGCIMNARKLENIQREDSGEWNDSNCNWIHNWQIDI